MFYISCFLQKLCLFLLCVGITIFFAGITPLKAADTWADWQPVYIRTVDISNGNQSLHSNISAITKDKQGFLWFGTAGSGLIRYDGQHADSLRYSPTQKLSLPDNVIHSLIALPDGGLLIGTDVAGVVRFNPLDNNFYPYPSTGNQNLGSRIYSIVADKKGGYWIGSDIGLSHIDADLKHTKQFFVFCQDNDTCSSQTRAIWEDEDGSLLLGTDNGLVQYSAKTQKFTTLLFKNSLFKNDMEGIRALYRDSKGRLWIGTEANGVFYMTADGKLHQPEALQKDSPFIRYHSVNDFVETFGGALWIGTRGGGVLSLDEKTGKINFIHRNVAASESLGSDSVRAFFREKTGNIWVATGDNVAFYTQEDDHIFTFNNNGMSNKSLADWNVFSILVTQNKQIWLGLGNGQVDWLNKKQGSIRHLKLEGLASGEAIHSLVELDDGTILAASKGLSRIDPNKLSISPYPVPGLSENLIVTNLLYKDGAVYIGTPEGLFIYHIKTNKTEHLTHTNSDKNSLSNNRILDLSFKPNGLLAIGTAKGLSFYKVDEKKFHNILHRNDNINTIPNDYIAALRSVGDKLWIGIRGALLEEKKGIFSLVSMPRNDVFCETIQSLINDTRNRLWIVGSSKLATIDPETKKIDRISRRIDDEKMIYYPHSAAIGADGEILLGGSNGLTVIPAEFRPDIVPEPKARLALTNIRINGQELPYGKLPTAGQTLNLSSHVTNLLLRFSLLDYGFTRQIRYSYRLLGQDSDWITLPAGSIPFVIYSRLPAGHFVFALRASIPGVDRPILETRFPVNVAYRLPF
ncbi:MAG: two-component regulator propeller domain-containing protein [Zymomonas mobilis]